MQSLLTKDNIRLSLIQFINDMLVNQLDGKLLVRTSLEQFSNIGNALDWSMAAEIFAVVLTDQLMQDLGIESNRLLIVDFLKNLQTYVEPTQQSKVNNILSDIQKYFGLHYLSRRLDAAMPSKCHVNVPTEVRVLIALPSSMGLKAYLPDYTESGDIIKKSDTVNSNVPILFPRDPQTGMLLPANLWLRLRAPNFDIDDDVKGIQLLPTIDSGMFTFFLTGHKSEAESRVVVGVYLDKQLKIEVGSVSLITAVYAKTTKVINQFFWNLVSLTIGGKGAKDESASTIDPTGNTSQTNIAVTGGNLIYVAKGGNNTNTDQSRQEISGNQTNIGGDVLSDGKAPMTREEKDVYFSQNEQIAVDKQINVDGNVLTGQHARMIQAGTYIENQSLGYSEEQVSNLVIQLSKVYQPKPFNGQCPYVGLVPFNIDDGKYFFGREKIVNELINRVKESRFMVVAGPSGSGKSSLVRAGLIYQLKQGRLPDSNRWFYETLKPGSNPLEELARVTSSLTGSLGAGEDILNKGLTDPTLLHKWINIAIKDERSRRVILLVDQFEEIFTQVQTDKERTAFLNLLIYAATIEKGSLTVIFTLRSDFISDCANYSQLNTLLNQQFIQVGAMTPSELVSAIAIPAIQAGLRIDPDLIAQIINDMGNEPGTLPLMQFTLKNLFDTQKSKGDVIALTRKEYLTNGGIQKALEKHATAELNRLDEAEQSVAKTVFTQLIRVGRDLKVTRRTTALDEIAQAYTDPAVVHKVINRLADARLITTDEKATKEMVTLAHERLIEAWPWLQQLANENRDTIALQSQISADASIWGDHGKNPSYLYSGVRLEDAYKKSLAKQLTLNDLTQKFLDEGMAVEEQGKRKEEEQRQRERKRAQIAIGIGTIAAILAAIAVILYYRANLSEAAAKQGNSLALAAQAEYLKDTEHDLALLLAVEANHVANTNAAQTSLLAVTTAKPGLMAYLPKHKNIVLDVGFSFDGKMAASVGDLDSSIMLWDVVKRTQHKILLSPNQVTRIAWHPSTLTLASADAAGNVILWDLSSENVVSQTLYTHSGAVSSLAFSKPDGHFLASGSCATTGWSLNSRFCEIGEINVWDSKLRKSITATLSVPMGSVTDLAFNVDGSMLASGNCPTSDCNKGTIQIWDIKQDWHLKQTLSEHTSSIISLAFDPHNSELLLSSGQGGISIWNVTTGQIVDNYPTTNNTTINIVRSLKFNVDGNRLVASECSNFKFSYIYNPVCIEGTVLVWEYSKDPQLSSPRRLVGHTDWINSIDIAPNGHTLFSGGRDRRLILWDSTATQQLGKVLLQKENATYKDLAISPNDELLAIGACTKKADTGFRCLEGEAQIFDLKANNMMYVVPAPVGGVQSVAFSPNQESQLLAIGGCGELDTKGICQEGMIRLWNVDKQQQVGNALLGHMATINTLNFSPDGSKLASGANDGTVILWDIATQRALTSPLWADNNFVHNVMFNADGSLLAASGGDSFITLWDSSSGQQKVRFHPAGAGGVTVISFNPDTQSNMLVSGGQDQHPPTLWNLDDYSPKALDIFGYIQAVAFNRTGTMIAITNLEGTVTLWDVVHQQKIGDLNIDTSLAPAKRLVFDKSGMQLVANTENAILTWTLDPISWERQACRLANRQYLTDAEWNKYFGDEIPHSICDI